MLTSTRMGPEESTDSCPGESAVVATATGADPPLSVIVPVSGMSSTPCAPGSVTGGWGGGVVGGEGETTGEGDGVAGWPEPDVHPATSAASAASSTRLI